MLCDPEREVGAIPLSSAGGRLGGPRPEMQGLWDRSIGRALVSRKRPYLALSMLRLLSSKAQGCKDF